MKKLSYVIVFVSDMSRAVRFYRDTLGLPLKFESPGWSEFLNDGTPIALHQAGQPGAGARPPEQPGTCRLGFQAVDLAATHAELVANGVTVVSPPAPAGYGLQQAVYADPDGFVFTVAQPPSRG